MNNNKFNSYNNLSPFYSDPKRLKVNWNFYTWNYSPSLTIDLSLSFYHRIIVNNNISIYYKNPRIGYLYVIYFEVAPFDILIYHHALDNIIIRADRRRRVLMSRAWQEEPKAIYVIFLCTIGGDIQNNITYLDVLLATSNLVVSET